MTLTLDDLLAMVGMVACVLPIAIPILLINPELTDDLIAWWRGWRR